ncbi:MAG: D-aminoacyl-tRNA deacylase [Gemmatimonadota bacterium]
MIQRVSRASVRVEGRTVGEIEAGLVVLVGFGEADDAAALEWVANKIWGLRVFADGEGRMNRSAEDDRLALLVISQFTLYGDVSRGRRPSFVRAARPETARALYDRFVEVCRRHGRVETGEFGAMMEVELVNDGPVTIQFER